MYHRKQTGRVQVGEGNPKINIVGGGDLVRYHKGRQIIFKEFLHIPKLTYNLISLNSLCENNTSLGKKSNTTFSVKKNKSDIFDGKIRKKLFFADLKNTIPKAMVSEYEGPGHDGSSEGFEACQLGKLTRPVRMWY